MTFKSLWHIAATASKIIEEDVITTTSSLEVDTLYSAISLGTELLVATGKVPQALHHKMNVPYMSGHFEFPIKYGYSLVGKTKNKELVHVMHPHQNKIHVSKEDCFYFSEKINPIVATQFSNLETVVNAIWTSNVQKNQKVLVCGTGSVGILLAETLKKHIGANVFVKETNLVKQQKLQALNFDLASDDDEFEICFNVSASEHGLQFCINHTITEGKIIELSWYGTEKVQLDLGGDFHYKRLQIVSSQVSDIPIKQKSNYTFFTRKKLVEQLMLDIDYLPLITNIVSFDELPIFFDELRNNKPNNHFITIVKY